MADGQITFSKWILVSVSTYAVFALVAIGLGALALNIPAQNLILPFGLIMLAGVVASGMVYWARQVLNEPKSWAIRFALSVFVFSLLFMSALIFSASRNGFIPRGSVLLDVSSFAFPGSAIGAIVVYFMARNRSNTQRY
ncbi:MAG: hypothetical protein KGO02_17075 [Alphaproteobacteria bacterium]|jgi:uncharacterized membrane protein (UPF0136 family)|nr:hypothetical protein [Alphaproteobacteria bacterium]